MAEVTVHTIPGSPFARAVLATLEEKQVSWDVNPLHPAALREPAHLSRNAFGKMPALEHKDFILYETQAILRYIDRVWPLPALTPQDPRLAARMDQAMNINDWYLFQGCQNVIGFQRVVRPRVLGAPADEAAVAAALPHSHKVFGELSRLLGDQRYFAGESISLAEMMLVPQLDFIAQCEEWSVLTAARPNLRHWFERVVVRPSFQATTWERVETKASAA